MRDDRRYWTLTRILLWAIGVPLLWVLLQTYGRVTSWGATPGPTWLVWTFLSVFLVVAVLVLEAAWRLLTPVAKAMFATKGWPTSRILFWALVPAGLFALGYFEVPVASTIANVFFALIALGVLWWALGWVALGFSRVVFGPPSGRSAAGLGRVVRRSLASHPVRAVLTISATAIGIFLYCFLTSIVTSLDAAVKAAAGNRIVVSSAVSLFQSLPTSAAYIDGIRETPGVSALTRFTWFGGVWPGEDAPGPQFGTDPEALLDIYPEVVIDPQQAKDWFADKKGGIVGRLLAESKGLKPGDQVALRGTIYPHVDGSPWTFNVRGIYRTTKPNVDEQTMHFHWSYLDETLAKGEAYGPRGTSVYLVRLEPGWRGEDVAAAIDAKFAGGPQRTRTGTEAAFQASWIGMLGNLPTFLGVIGGAVVVALLFGVVNTMTIAARERVRTMGIVKALGFSDAVPMRLYLLESLLLVGLGGGTGILLIWVLQGYFQDQFKQFVPQYFIGGPTMVEAGLICLGIALLAGLIPALRVRRLKAVDALRT